MTKNDAIKLILQRRIKEWNAYRKRNSEWIPDLSNFQFPSFNLRGIDLKNADLRGADLSNADIYLWFWVPRIRGAKYSIDTKWPPNFDPVDFDCILTSEEVKLQMQIPKVFLSYAWANKASVLAIDQWLRDKGLETRIDERDFFAGSRIRDEILRVMKACDAVIIFYSVESKDKPWPEFERELAADLEMDAKKEGKTPPRIIYVVLDKIELPTVTERNRIAVIAAGKRFPVVCEEIYRGVLGLPQNPQVINLQEWENYEF